MDKITDRYREALKYLKKVNRPTIKKLAEVGECSPRHIQAILSDKERRGASGDVGSKLAKHFKQTYSDMLNLGQWILDGKKGEDWVQPAHGTLSAITGSATATLGGSVELSADSPTATATDNSTVVVGDGSAGRDAININGGTSIQLSDLELKVIKLNREYGNNNLLKGFLGKLKELKKIADNMF